MTGMVVNRDILIGDTGDNILVSGACRCYRETVRYLCAWNF